MSPVTNVLRGGPSVKFADEGSSKVFDVNIMFWAFNIFGSVGSLKQPSPLVSTKMRSYEKNKNS